MAVETSRYDAGGFRDFTQAQAAESSAAIHQAPGSVHQGVTGLLFLFGAGQHRKGVFWTGTRRTLANRLCWRRTTVGGITRGCVASIKRAYENSKAQSGDWAFFQGGHGA
ncbi:hypothetical protein D3C73_625140 [compost metagenome]